MSENRKPFETFAHYKIGKGFATLSVSVDEGDVVVGVAYCHPRDGINKTKGREIARARRDIGSDFSFEFTRNGSKLGDQLRAEFEKFMVESRNALLTLRDNDIAERVGAPPWALHSFARQLRKVQRQAVGSGEIPDSCGCC